MIRDARGNRIPDDTVPMAPEKAGRTLAWPEGKYPGPIAIDAPCRVPGPSTGTGTELATKEKP